MERHQLTVSKEICMEPWCLLGTAVILPSLFVTARLSLEGLGNYFTKLAYRPI
jgi:hypothetical protein